VALVPIPIGNSDKTPCQHTIRGFRASIIQSDAKVPDLPPSIAETAGRRARLVPMRELWILAYIGMRYLGMVFPVLELHIPLAVMTGIVLGSYGWLARRLWKTRLVNPRPCDPCNRDMDWGGMTAGEIDTTSL
jgi:hypothetical protein